LNIFENEIWGRARVAKEAKKKKTLFTSCNTYFIMSPTQFDVLFPGNSFWPRLYVFIHNPDQNILEN
jgi:hypothetical protein